MDGRSTARPSTGLGLWRTLWEAGQPHGMLAGGYRAIDSLRLQKGYRVWGADITPDETPYEDGYGYIVERSLAYAYLPPDHSDPGTAVEIFGQWVEGEVAKEPLFDPQGERVRT
ncbi:MAG TPA: glycine cleavage T C-terminal barrel domain-containing protein [Solirubrobacterales bacterium]|nr:glycine cleavage T C-terminal barrel domain-containing protein [Solirubrobacterales bacterium]